MSALGVLFDDDVVDKVLEYKGEIKPTAPAAPSAPAVATPNQRRKEKNAAWLTVLAGGGALVGGYAAALIISWKWNQPTAPVLADGMNALGLLFIMALAIERFVEPFAPWLGPNTDLPKMELRKLKEKKDPTDADKASMSELQAKIDDGRSKTSLVTWGVATGLAALITVGLNTTLLGAVLSSTSSRPPYWVDLLVTALAVGAGTKPLNDMWTRLQKKSGDDTTSTGAK